MRLWALIVLLFVSSFTHSEPASLDGGRLFELRCNVCHQLPNPNMLNLRQWAWVINTMQTRMQQADIPALSKEEVAAIMAYLELQSND